MKSLISIIGVLLIIFGLATFVYKGFSYTKQEEVAKIGNVQLTADTQKTVWFPPMLGGASIVVGVILVAAARFGKK